MKKLTAFFMALMPLLITILLFAAGLIVKNSTHVYVQSVSINHDSLALQVTDESKPKEYQLETSVIPTNATNPDLFWTTSNENIVEVDSTGKLKTKGYGEAYVYATSKENPLVTAKCAIEVWDDKIHHIEIANSFNAEQLAYNQTLKLEPILIPSTHILDKTLTYSSSNEEVVKAYPDGTLQASDGKSGKSTITIETASEKQTKVTKQLDVQVSAGVIKIDTKDATEAITPNKTYDLKDQIVSYPTKETKASDFEFSVDKPEIAKVDANGIVTFLQPGTVKAHAVYKRNPDLIVDKTITSTFQCIEEVYFNKYEFKDNLSNYTVNKNLPITYATFPTDANETYLKFESSDETIVSPVFENNKWVFRAVGPGVAILKATATTSHGFEQTDYCMVTLTSSDIGSRIFKADNVSADTYYYSIRDNLNMNLYQTLNNPKWEVSSETEGATIDEKNLIVHAKANSKVSVKLSSDGQDYWFTINFTNTIKQLPIIENVFNIKVGQNYEFSGCYVTGLDSKAFDAQYQDPLELQATSFIPRNGGTYEVTLQDGSISGKTIKLIVEEAPIDIKLNNVNQHYVTTENKVLVNNIFNPTLLPMNDDGVSTATKPNGASYKLDYEYIPDDEQVVHISNNQITFDQPSTVLVNMSVEDTMSKSVTVHSTCGDIGKFTLTDGTKDIGSGETIQVIKNEVKKLTINQVYTGVEATSEILNQLDVVSYNSKITATKEIVDDKIVFTIQSSEQGINNVVIKSGTFSFMLNLNVSSEVEKITLYNRGRELKNDSNVFAYSNNFNLDVIAEPISADSSNIKATITPPGGQPKELTISSTHKITIDPTLMPTVGIYTINLTVENKIHQIVETTYKFEYKTDISESDITIPEADDKGNIYIEANATQSISTVTINGIVSDDFYSKFKIKFGQGQEQQLLYNKIVLTDIPDPTEQNPEFEIDGVLTYSGSVNNFEKHIHISRDIVSRIVLPKHDNLDMTDKKGLQKVHVYGNKSWFDDNLKSVDYYRLPIDLYSYKGTKIEDATLKEKAYNSLYVSFSDGKSTAKYNINGYVEVRFAPESLYTYEEIFDDAFDSKDNKNVTINVSNKTKIASAQYTFVAVDGTNIYTEEGLMSVSAAQPPTGPFNPLVIQTNFGLEDVEKDNVKWQKTYVSYPFIILYGNGYTLNFDKKTMSLPDGERWAVQSCVCINAVLEGSYDRNLSWIKQSTIGLNEYAGWSKAVKKHYRFKYNIVKNWSEGIAIDYDFPENDTLIQNCLFYRAINSSINVGYSGKKPTLYLENCVFFGCASFPIMATNNAKVCFKGMIDVYNFHSSDMFNHLMSPMLSQQLFNLMAVAARAANMSQVGADGREYINSFMVTGLDKEIYFWNGTEYVKDVKGNPLAANYTGKYVDLRLPDFMPDPYKGLEAGLWATDNPTPDKPSPSYYDEYDHDGNLRFDFLANQINKLTRKIKYF